MEYLHPHGSLDTDRTPRLLITVHGIRTFGAWQERLEQKLRGETEEAVEVYHYRYGFFTFLAYIIPIFRWLATKRFQDELLEKTSSRAWSRIDIIAHSFGAHLVGWSLLRLPKSRRPLIHTIIFAGSVLRDTFPVRELVSNSVRRLVNDCGLKDNVLLINQIFVLLTGMAGRIGLVGMEGESFCNRYFDLGHSGYFQVATDSGRPDFMSEYWIPLLLSNSGISRHDEREGKGINDLTTFLLRTAEPIKLVIYIAPILALLYYVNHLRVEARNEAVAALKAQAYAQDQAAAAKR